MIFRIGKVETGNSALAVFGTPSGAQEEKWKGWNLLTLEEVAAALLSLCSFLW
jgi:hypothetical protein